VSVAREMSGGVDANEARRLRRVEEKNRRPKKIVAQQALDLDALKVVLEKKCSPAGEARSCACRAGTNRAERSTRLRADRDDRGSWDAQFIP
jgi:hypothetical protein